MRIEAKNPEEYIEKLPEQRREAFANLRKAIVSHLPAGYEETMTYGMIGYVVPHKIYPPGYHADPSTPLPFCSIASQKNFIGFYHMGMYAMPELKDWFAENYRKRAKYKLDMGKSCVRLKRPDDIPYDLIGELMKKISPAEWVEVYEKGIRK